MGNHGVDGARVRAGTANNRAIESANTNFSRSGLLNLSNWPVSRRLFAVIVVALLMGLVFGGLRVASADSSATQFGRVSQLASLDQRLSGLIQDLQNERDTTLSFLLNGASNSTTKSEIAQLYDQTDQGVAAVQQSASGIGGAFPANIQGDAKTVLADISSGRIAALHQSLNPQVPQTEQSVIGNYAAVINDMLTLADQTAQGVSDANLASDVRAFDELGLAKEEVSQQRGLVNYSFSTTTGPTDNATGVDSNTLLALQVASDTEFSDESAFQSAATPAEQAFLTDAVSSGSAQNVAFAQELELEILGNPGQSLLASVKQGIGPVNAAGVNNFKTMIPGEQIWDTGMTGEINAMQATENVIADNILNRANQLQSGAQGSALSTAIATAVVLLLVLLAALLVARSLVLPLRRLRAGALDVATVQLPDRVRRLSDSPDPANDLEVSPIAVLSSDEIGQVARAFDQVHAEAVRLAGNEAVLRTSFNAMFVNLSRRSQSLIERLARMIDSLEQNEDDPDRLSNLFSMDHLVTRMRRNSENLLLLAGHESPRKWTEPVPLADITRAATSEIEQYNRVVLNVQPGVSVIGQAVSDVVHLLAELIENATIFSPKDTQVLVSAQELTSGGVLIEVTDKGIGVSESRLAEMNWRLDNPPVMDVSVSRHMGLFAVARLAERHRIRVRLRPAVPQGLTALVWLPDTVIERSVRAYSGTGSWQSVGDGAQTSNFLQSRRGTGQHSLAAAVSQRASGRHGVMRPAGDVATAPARDEGMAVSAMSGFGSPQQAQLPEPPVSQATSAWFRSRHTAMGAAARMPVNLGGVGNGHDSGNGYDAGSGHGNGGAMAGMQAGAPAPQTDWGAQPPSGWAQEPSTDWGPASSLAPGGRRPADIVADPVQGEQTSAGLPMRVPKANLIPGSAPGGRGGGPGGGNGMPASSMGAGGGADSQSQPLPQRSPEQARSRLSGFQRGARRAESQPPRAGEGTDR
jgi:signal transduction histidine kinase